MRFATLLFPTLLLTACADQGEFPSLAKRPIENARAEPITEPAPPPADPALAQRWTDIANTGKAGVEAFELSLDAAKRAVAASGPSGSESWIAAQVAVSRLETTLTPAREALATLDAERKTVVTGGNATDLAALETIIAELEEVEKRQASETKALIDTVSG